jgi:membrane protease YdiL (CAAX protease family)
MKELIRKQPVLCGVAGAIAITALFVPAQMLIPSGISDVLWLLWDSALRVIYTVPCLILLGWILQSSGFRFAFTTKGFAKGMFACAAIFLFILTMALRWCNMLELNMDYAAKVPGVIAQQITTGLFEEAAFRGLFMTAMLIQWSDTAKGRIFVVLISGLVFGVSHFKGGLFSVLIASILGIGFSAVYLYSKNLMSCMLLHALYDIPAHLSHLIAESSENTLHHILNNAQTILMYAAIPLFALFLCVKAKPFELKERRPCLS